MAKRKRRASAELRDIIARALVLLFIIAYAPVIAWWNSIPPNGRIFLIVMISIAVVVAIGAVIMFSIYRKREHARVWRLAMAGWQNNVQGNMFAERQSAIAMSDVELEKFAAQIYKKMGYHVQHVGDTGDHGVDVLLINPKNQKEVVQCKQWNKPIGEPVIRDLYGTMGHEGAVRGWLWAPRGFSEPAKRWAKGKNIELIDDDEIGRLIALTFGRSK